MSDCLYCKKPAGFFKKKHPECEARYHQGQQQMIAAVSKAIIDGDDGLDKLEMALDQIEQSALIPASERIAHMVSGFEAAVDEFLFDDILDRTEETKLATFQSRFELSQRDLNQNGALSKVVKSAVLRDLCDGIISNRFQLDGLPAINYQKGEQVVWAFQNAEFLEDKTRREFVGASNGVSIKIAKGVYYRTTAFKGRPVEHTERVHVDSGWVIITDKNIYFSGQKKSVRFPYQKIISFETYSNGIGIMRDTATAKPQIFITGDGWFTYNLVTNLSKL
jgi:hypothetical protein